MNVYAQVLAARALSLMENEMDDPGYASRATPRQAAGITIVIESGASAKVLNPPTIDAEAEYAEQPYP